MKNKSILIIMIIIIAISMFGIVSISYATCSNCMNNNHGGCLMGTQNKYYNETYHVAYCKCCSAQIQGGQSKHYGGTATCTTKAKCSSCGSSYGSTLGHNYKAATCTSAKKCTRCGGTLGSALGHNYTEGSCTEASKCTRCGDIKSVPTGHPGYTAATCTSPARCIKCGAKDGEALGHSYKAATCTSAKKCTRCGVISGSSLGHDYTEGSCTEASKCTRCGDIKSVPTGHPGYVAATCTTPARCIKCGAEDGKALGHSYKAATCTSAKKCTRCGVTSGSSLGHNYTGGSCTEASKCTRCGDIKSVPTGHPGYVAATCTSPARCIRCGAEDGKPLGHSYKAATCTTVAKCTRCGVTSGSAIGHDYTEGSCTEASKCTRCGDIKSVPTGHPGYVAATCTSPARCIRCGAKDGKALGHDYDVTYNQATTTYHIKVEDCTRCSSIKETKQNHTFNSKNICKYCDEKKLEEEHPEEENDTNKICANCMNNNHGGCLKGTQNKYSSATYHVAYCKCCDAQIQGGQSKHYGGTATCTAKPICLSCGRSYGKVLEHTVSEWTKITNYEHSGPCARCNKMIEEEHIFENGICVECDSPTKEYKVKCTNNKINRLHTITFEYMKITATTHNFKYSCDECNFRSTEIKNKKHKYDANGKCECGREVCSEGNIKDDHNLKITYKASTDSAVKAEKHIVVTKCTECNVTYETLANHEFNEKGICAIQNCGYKNPHFEEKTDVEDDSLPEEYKVKCTNNKINRLHTITFEYMKITASTHNFKYSCAECNFRSTEIKNKKHKYDVDGKCECGREVCSEGNIKDDHKLKITYKASTDSVVKAEKHIVVTKCTECIVTYETLADHEFNEKGICTTENCGYKNPLKAKCTEKAAVSGHDINVLRCEKIVSKSGKEDKYQHAIEQYCNTCSVEIKGNSNHTFDNLGKCICGYVDINKAKCTEEAFVANHTIKTSYSCKTIEDNVTKDNYHVATKTCNKCKVSVESLEPHTYDTNGKCTTVGCGYKNPLKASCTEKKAVKEHNVYANSYKYYNMYNHYIVYHCNLCSKDIVTKEYTSHTFDDDGKCTGIGCGYENAKKKRCNENRFIDTHKVSTDYEGDSTGHRVIKNCKTCKVKVRYDYEPHDYSKKIKQTVKPISYLVHSVATTQCSICDVKNYETPENHTFENGICTGCDYKKLICKSNSFVAEHVRTTVGVRQLPASDKQASKNHIILYNCNECGKIEYAAPHAFNAEGKCNVCDYETTSKKVKKCSLDMALKEHENKLKIKYIVVDENIHTKVGFCSTCEMNVTLETGLSHSDADGNGDCDSCKYNRNNLGVQLLTARLGTFPGHTINSEKYNDGIDEFNPVNYKSAVGKEELRPGGDGWDCQDKTVGVPIDEYTLVADPETRTSFTYYPDITFTPSENNTSNLTGQQLIDAALVETSPDCYAYRLIDSNWKDVAVTMGTYTYDGYADKGHSFNVYYIPEEICGVEGGCYAVQSGGYAGVDADWTVK